MARLPQDGDFYIQRNNQDFWLRENGAWVRKGNIRDEGAPGVVVINPVVGLGYLQSSTLTRQRFIEFDQAYSLGFALSAVISKSRDVHADMGFGVDGALTLLRTRELSVAIDLGFSLASQFGINLPADMAFGYLNDVTLTRNRQLTLNMAMGFSQTPTPVVDHGIALSAAMDLGFLESQGLDKTKALAAAMAIGFAEGVTLVVSVPLPANTHLYGYDQATTLSHANTTPVRTSLTTFASSGTDGSTATTPSFSVSAARMIILDVAREGTGNVTSTTTVTDNKGLTWTKQSESAHFHSIPGFWYRVERWWAYAASAQTGMTVSFTFNRAGSASNNVFASVYNYSGVAKANGGTPFLAGGSATATQDSNTASSVTANATPGTTTPTVLLGCAVYRDANTPPTAGSTYTQVNRLGNQSSSGIMSFIDEELISTSAISSPHAVNFTNNQAFWEFVVDVIDCS